MRATTKSSEYLFLNTNITENLNCTKIGNNWVVFENINYDGILIQIDQCHAF